MLFFNFNSTLLLRQFRGLASTAWVCWPLPKRHLRFGTICDHFWRQLCPVERERQLFAPRGTFMKLLVEQALDKSKWSFSSLLCACWLMAFVQLPFAFSNVHLFGPKGVNKKRVLGQCAGHWPCKKRLKSQKEKAIHPAQRIYDAFAMPSQRVVAHGFLPPLTAALSTYGLIHWLSQCRDRWNGGGARICSLAVKRKMPLRYWRRTSNALLVEATMLLPKGSLYLPMKFVWPNRKPRKSKVWRHGRVCIDSPRRCQKVHLPENAGEKARGEFNPFGSRHFGLLKLDKGKFLGAGW